MNIKHLSDYLEYILCIKSTQTSDLRDIHRYFDKMNATCFLATQMSMTSVISIWWRGYTTIWHISTPNSREWLYSNYDCTFLLMRISSSIANEGSNDWVSAILLADCIGLQAPVFYFAHTKPLWSFGEPKDEWFLPLCLYVCHPPVSPFLTVSLPFRHI